MYSFSKFGNDLDSIVDNATSYQEIIQKGSSCMKHLLQTPNLLDQGYINALLEGAINNTIYKSDRNDFVLQVFVWHGKSETPIHDHLTWGILGVYRNCLNVKEFKMSSIGDNFYDVNMISEYQADQGGVCYLIPPDEEIHKISNPTDSLSISFHVYGKDIKEYNIYDLENGEIIHQIV